MHQPQQHAVGHVPVAQRHRAHVLAEMTGVQADPLVDFAVHADAARALRELVRQVAALPVIQVEDQRALPGQRLADACAP